MVAVKSENLIDSEAKLRDIIGDVMDIAAAKAIPKLDKYCREYISRSPFVCLGTADANGRVDVSPRGDQPGFVQVLDDNALFIPERPGNRRLDSLTNILSNPGVGLLFMVPGYDETLRVNGSAKLVNTPALLDAAAVKGKQPLIGIQIDVQEAYLHCAKAFRRSNLWKPDAIQDRSEMPSLAKMVLEQISPPDSPPDDATIQAGDEMIEDNYRNEMY